MRTKLFAALFSSLLITTVSAEPSVVVEESTPPPAETALTPNQLPPIMAAVKPPTQNPNENNANPNIQGN